MMRSYLPGAFTAAPIPASPVPRLSGFNRCFDLQIVHGLPQVKMRLPAAACAAFRISLGFKQLARGLHLFS
jgi:hypothetical protein